MRLRNAGSATRTACCRDLGGEADGGQGGTHGEEGEKGGGRRGEVGIDGGLQCLPAGLRERAALGRVGT